MIQDNVEYPIKKYDHLNRMIYVDWNGVERCVNIFWENTKNIKIKYRLWSEESEIEAYDKSGNVIIHCSAGKLSVKLPRFRMDNEKIKYIVDKKKIKEWIQKLESKKK